MKIGINIIIIIIKGILLTITTLISIILILAYF